MLGRSDLAVFYATVSDAADRVKQGERAELREFKRRAAIEPVIGHLKEHHRMGRNYLAHASGDAVNAVLAD